MEVKEVKQKKKGIKVITLIIFGIILVLILGMQVFASVNGYGNIFFMLKTIAKGEAHGENEIFYDKEITLSNKSFEVTDGVRMQINKLQIKEEESILCVTVKASKDKELPLTYSIMSDGLSKTNLESTEAQELGEFEDLLKVNYQFAYDELITLFIKNNDGKELKKVEINLYTREITVTDDGEVDKISQIELKKYLDVFSELNNDFGIENDRLILSAIHFDKKIYNLSDVPTSEEINKIIKELYGEDNVEFNSIKNNDGKEIEVIDLKNSKALKYNIDADAYINTKELIDYKNGICLKIKDIDYEDSIYTVKYIYTFATDDEIKNEKIEELAQYETTIKLKINDDAQYSKYQLIELEKGKKVRENIEVDLHESLKNNISVSNTINNDNNNVVNNNVSNTNNSNTNISNTVNSNTNNLESQQWDYDFDKHDHIYKVVLNTGNKASDGTHTTLDGTHIEKCSICGEERRVRHNFGKWFTINVGTGKAYTLWCNDCKDYVYTTDYNFVKQSGYEMNEENNSNEISNNENRTNVNIIDSRFKLGESYTITYTSPDKKYKTDIVECKENGKVIATFVGGNGEYVLGIITKSDDTNNINLAKKKCIINNGVVEKSEYSNIKVTIENSQLKSGNEYDVTYTDPYGKYKNKNAISNEDGKIQIEINGTSGKYVVGIIVDKNNKTIQSNGYYFEVDDFGNSK